MEYNIKPTKPPRQEGGFPQTIPQLIQKYKLDSLWDNISSMVKEIIEQNSGYVVKRDGVMYIADNNNLEKAVVVLRIGQNFLDISNNGINGDYTTIISKNGIINADFIKAGTISADRIKGGTLIVGGKDNGNGTIKVNDANGNTNILMNNQGIQLSDGATLVGGKGLLTNLQFIGRIVSSNDNAKNTSNGDFSMLGFECGGFLEGVARTYMSITPEIPKNFTIQKANLII